MFGLIQQGSLLTLLCVPSHYSHLQYNYRHYSLQHFSPRPEIHLDVIASTALSLLYNTAQLSSQHKEGGHISISKQKRGGKWLLSRFRLWKVHTIYSCYVKMAWRIRSINLFGTFHKSCCRKKRYYIIFLHVIVISSLLAHVKIPPPFAKLMHQLHNPQMI